MRIVSLLLFVIVIGQRLYSQDVRHERALYLNSTSDPVEVKTLKSENPFQVEFIESNKFKMNGKVLDSTSLVLELKAQFEKKEKAKTILIIFSKDRTHKEFVFIVDQFQRSLLRAKDLISLEQFHFKYMELNNQKSVDIIDAMVTHHLMVVDK